MQKLVHRDDFRIFFLYFCNSKNKNISQTKSRSPYTSIENDTQHQEGGTTQTRVLKIIPSSKRNTPRKQRVTHHPHGYRKRYPTHKRHTHPPSRVLKIIPNSKREEQQHRQRAAHHPHGYRKRYPANKRHTPPPSRVLKKHTQHEKGGTTPQTKSRSPSTDIETIPSTQKALLPRNHGCRKRYPAIECIRSLGNLMILGKIAFAKPPNFFNLTNL